MSEDWARLIETGKGSRPDPIRAHTFLRAFGTFSKPVVLQCEDGNQYVVKGRQVGRAIVNDQIVGRLGALIDAPVANVALICVPHELLAAQSEMQHMASGVAHGSRWIAGCTERMGVNHVRVDGNRLRFATLAVLYGWVSAGDHQFVYQNSEPHLVYSVDHGHFFPSGPNWSAAALAAPGASCPDSQLVASCALTEAELQEAVSRLERVEIRMIAEAVTAPPEEWGFTDSERIALAEYLEKRRTDILMAYGRKI